MPEYEKNEDGTFRTDDNGAPIQKQLQKGLRALTWATVVIYLALAGLVGFVWKDSSNRRADLAKVANETNDALCTLRTDLKNRVKTSKDFLAANPNGIPGITAATLRQSIRNQQSTIEALSELDCPLDPPLP